MGSLTVYVRNLPEEISNEELASVFEAYGRVVSARIIGDKRTKKSHGYGFVEMASEEAAERAIESLHGAELEGKDLDVQPAKARGPGSGYRSLFGRRPN